MERITIFMCVCLLAAIARAQNLSYPIVDTHQAQCFDDRREIQPPAAASPYYGQDAQHRGNQPAYRANGDGTITDLVTGLMWQSDPAPGSKVSYDQAVAGAARCRTGGYTDWRLPTIKELYSLIDFSGTDPDPHSRDTSKLHPFIDTRYFKFRYGQQADGDRIIDSQWVTSTRYVSVTMQGNPTVFGVNFADGRIKGYPLTDPRGDQPKLFYCIYVRGNPPYGQNDFIDNHDGTVTDRATGLTWMQIDSGALKAGRNHDGQLNWAEALQWAKTLHYAGHDDWRLPNAKELQSIVDYTRSPDTTRSPAIDPIFKCTLIGVEEHRHDFGFYWTGTTHIRAPGNLPGTLPDAVSGGDAVYVAFGRAYGYMSDPRTGQLNLWDVHGAGCQRSDPKAGDPALFPHGMGPQGDVRRIYNMARCVRGGQ